MVCVGGYHLLLALSRWTIDHASLSRRSTVPTPNRDLSNVWALSTFIPFIKFWFSLILSPSSWAVRGHHIFPGIAVLSRLCTKLVRVTSVYFLVFSFNIPFLFVQFTSRHLASSTLVCIAARAALCAIFVHPTTGIRVCSFWQVQVPYTKTQFQHFRVVRWTVQ